jgi:membrane-associated phospholipid phosphatase
VLLISLYLVPTRLPVRPVVHLDQSTVDFWIPFVEWTIWFYVSEYPLVFLAVWLGTDDLVRSRTFYALILASLTGSLIFVLWPTDVVRQSPSFVGATGLLWRALYTVDTPANALPSLHVANTCLSASCVYRLGRAWRFITPVWVALIIVSTLTTKQHYAIDIAGGIVLAAACFLAVRLCVRFR